MVLDNVSGAGDRINSAIQAASRTTGTSFDFLMRTAARESAFDPTAKASTSSARGLFQFIDTTWLAMMKEEGPRYGLAQYAAFVDKTTSGGYTVRDPAKRAEILKLRDDPSISALLAGALASRNADYLTTNMGRQPTSGELYIAHFLGASGARKLISLAENQPFASAANVFPDAARANRPIFYKPDGSARSAADVYAGLVAKHDYAPPPQLVPQPGIVQVVTSDQPDGSQPVSLAQAVPAARTAVRSQGSGVRMVQVQLPDLESPSAASGLNAQNGPIFQSMFSTERSGPVSDTVREIWSSGDGSTTTRRVVSVNTDSAGTPTDLSTFQKDSVGNSGRRSGT
ncbi:MAG TPA: transglycosylase SLT domain-containing protein [Xanthobacteraceae bacterium]|nr:transglycosylase SLT domain-containing protein [Xanthobacteraceae bacterium]